MFERCTWLNEPQQWRLDGGTLHVRTDLKIDFWRETHYGFIRHSGQVFGCRTSSGFTASVRVRGAVRELYDQAGIMVLLDERAWIKAGARRPRGGVFGVHGDAADRQGAA